ncbi:MAG TPA: hypothetical protein VKT28_06665 [Puia sp.]|nr:hypothetical protein [Puia sp.]
MSNSQQPKSDSGKVLKQVEHRVERLVPPDNIKSKFKTLKSWLFSICDKDKPDKAIAEYMFNFFESAGKYTLFLVGVNIYEKAPSHSVTRIEFQPTDMYYKLRRSEHKNLTREQLQKKLICELKDFTSTEKFRNSFLAKANAIIMESNGETI